MDKGDKMEGKEIRKQVDDNYKKMEKMSVPELGILNVDISNLIDANIYLQNICRHEFINGRCKFCDKGEK